MFGYLCFLSEKDLEILEAFKHIYIYIRYLSIYNFKGLVFLLAFAFLIAGFSMGISEDPDACREIYNRLYTSLNVNNSINYLSSLRQGIIYSPGMFCLSQPISSSACYTEERYTKRHKIQSQTCQGSSDTLHAYKSLWSKKAKPAYVCLL